MIISKLGMVMADRGVGVNDLAERIGIAPTNLTRMRTGKIRGLRFSTLNALCTELQCQPGDLFVFVADDIGAPDEASYVIKPNPRTFEAMEKEHPDQ
jgi:putative transcriptional regulator